MKNLEEKIFKMIKEARLNYEDINDIIKIKDMNTTLKNEILKTDKVFYSFKKSRIFNRLYEFKLWVNKQYFGEKLSAKLENIGRVTHDEEYEPNIEDFEYQIIECIYGVINDYNNELIELETEEIKSTKQVMTNLEKNALNLMNILEYYSVEVHEINCDEKISETNPVLAWIPHYLWEKIMHDAVKPFIRNDEPFPAIIREENICVNLYELLGEFSYIIFNQTSD